MLKALLLISILPTASYGQNKSCEVPPPTEPFEVRGTDCANPWNGWEQPNFGAAASQADTLALKICYPYQAHRIVEYRFYEDHQCPPGRHPSVATAQYRCAR